MSELSDYLSAQLTGIEVVAPDAPPPEFTLAMASDAIFSVLDPHIERLYPASTIKNRAYPDAVYNIASGPVQKTYQNTVIAYTTLYDVVIREKSHADLMTLVASVENAIKGSPGYQRVDSADDYLEEENAYRMGLNIEVSRPVSVDLTTMPAKSIIISNDGYTAGPNEWDNCTRQQVFYDVAIISTATSKAALQSIRDDVQAKLMGWSHPGGYSRMNLKQGDNLQADAGLYSSVDVYTHWKWVVKDNAIP